MLMHDPPHPGFGELGARGSTARAATSRPSYGTIMQRLYSGLRQSCPETGAEAEMALRSVDKMRAVPRISRSGPSSSSAERAGPEQPEWKEPSSLAIGD